MAAAEYIALNYQDAEFPEDRMVICGPVIPGDLPSIQIDQGDGVSAYVSFRPEDADAIAKAVLLAAGDP